MPKNVSRKKSQNGAVTRHRPCCKFRIGTRKSGVSAQLMSSAALTALLSDESKRRYFSKIVTVLRNRGVEVDYPRRPAKVDPLAGIVAA